MLPDNKYAAATRAMQGEVLGRIPYRYVLLGSLLLIGFGLFRLWRNDRQ